MGRKRQGHESKKTCEQCHERITQSRAFSDYRRGIKVYLCPMCAKRRGLRIKHAYLRKNQNFRSKQTR